MNKYQFINNVRIIINDVRGFGIDSFRVAKRIIISLFIVQCKVMLLLKCKRNRHNDLQNLSL